MPLALMASGGTGDGASPPVEGTLGLEGLLPIFISKFVPKETPALVEPSFIFGNSVRELCSSGRASPNSEPPSFFCHLE